MIFIFIVIPDDLSHHRLISLTAQLSDVYNGPLTEFLGKKFSLKDLEHGLCEFEKYFRLASGESQAGRIYRPRVKPDIRQCACALCEPEQELEEEISPWVICGSWGRIEERWRNNSARSLV